MAIKRLIKWICKNGDQNKVRRHNTRYSAWLNLIFTASFIHRRVFLTARKYMPRRLATHHIATR